MSIKRSLLVLGIVTFCMSPLCAQGAKGYDQPRWQKGGQMDSSQTPRYVPPYNQGYSARPRSAEGMISKQHLNLFAADGQLDYGFIANLETELVLHFKDMPVKNINDVMNALINYLADNYGVEKAFMQPLCQRIIVDAKKFGFVDNRGLMIRDYAKSANGMLTSAVYRNYITNEFKSQFIRWINDVNSGQYTMDSLADMMNRMVPYNKNDAFIIAFVGQITEKTHLLFMNGELDGGNRSQETSILGEDGCGAMSGALAGFSDGPWGTVIGGILGAAAFSILFLF